MPAWLRPAGRPVMAQTWHDVLFAHWPMPADELRRALPASLELDTYDGRAWLGVIPFRMAGVRRRGLPALPWLSAFAELNMRTYVTFGGKPGVFFFSLDASNRLAVEVARRRYHLPYFHAKMEVTAAGEWIAYTCERVHRGAPPAAFRARYRPTGDVFRAPRSSLEYFLTERYALYTPDRHQQLCRAEIRHASWPLQPAAAEIAVNTMAQSHGFCLPQTPPLLHFARRLEVDVWPLRRVGT